MEPSHTGEALALVRARALVALNIARQALAFADPTSEQANSPEAWRQAGGELDYLRLEALHAALMRLGGASWDRLGDHRALRQNTYRRLNPRIRTQTSEAVALPVSMDVEQELDDRVDEVLRRTCILKDRLQADLVDAARRIAERPWSRRG